MTTTTFDVRETGLAAMAFSRNLFFNIADNIPEDKSTFQPCPGANHLIWVLGHAAWTDDYFLTKLGNQESQMTEEWSKQFGMGSSPVDDASAYPTREEVRTACEESRERLLQWLRDLSDEALQEPLPEDWKSFAENYGVLISVMAAHETLHAGQLSVVRKALGLKPLMG